MRIPAFPLRASLIFILPFPTAALAHGSEIFILSGALQVISAVVLLTALVASSVAIRRKLLVGATYALAVFVAWLVYRVAEPSVMTVFTIPVLLPAAAALIVFFGSRPPRNGKQHA